MFFRSRSLKALPIVTLVACASSAPPPPSTQAPTPTPISSPAATEPVASATSTPAAPHPIALEGIDETALDPSVAACDDFYQYACGGWMKATPIPDDQAAWDRSFSVLNEQNEIALRQILENDAAGKGTDPYSKQLGDYYASCMDEDAIEKVGMAGLSDELSRIDAIKDASTLSKELGRLQAAGVDAAFGFGSEPDLKNSDMVIGAFGHGGLGLPERDYYLRPDAKSKELRAKYVTHVAKMLELLGDKPAAATASAAKIMKLETALAKGTLSIVDRRDPEKIYHRIDLTGLMKAAPMIDWAGFLTELGAPGVKDINVTEPAYAATVSALVKSTPMAEWKTYLRWRLLDDLGGTLPKAVIAERFAFSQLLSGAKTDMPRWKRCTRRLGDEMGEALSIPFVREHLGEDGKAAARALVASIELSMKDNLAKLSWMDDTTRAKAVEKLGLVSNMIGYPDKWRNYDGLEITRSSYAKNLMASKAFENRRQLAKIGKKTDKTEWEMVPAIVNAYYEPLNNQMVFPAGILQKPVYSTKFIAAANYGALGWVMGHELTHGFDDQGRKFDAHGNLTDWWTPSVGAGFDKRAACVSSQFDQFVVTGDLHVNGKLVLGESIADLGGLKLAYQTWKHAQPASGKTGSFTDDQQFFLAAAQGWCENIRPELARRIAQSDPHPPNPTRVNGTMSNLPEFAAAFGCKEGSKMARPKAERCEIW